MIQHRNHYTFLFEVKGLVQGVGFRPFIYRIAHALDLKGSVENRNDGVFIKVNCTEIVSRQFESLIREKSPPASKIESIVIKKIESESFDKFEIVESKTVSDQITIVSPDIAVCEECMDDCKTQKNRISYPFVNCTNCGPRFTIIKDLPYDRDKTSMREFEMCPDCLKEYVDVSDRRFHAQPVACSICGPEYTLFESETVVKDINSIILRLVSLIKNKKIVAIKGLGGFFLACDAHCEETVARLRLLKQRESKPFAVMFEGLSSLKKYAFVDFDEEISLLSWRRPIVLLKQKNKLAPSVTVGFNTIGAMLPYMPLHHLFFEKSDINAIVLTSGNISDEPIITNNSVAIQKLSGIADAILVYNREIYNRTDDSVVTIVNKKERIVRRSRGYVPMPVNVPLNVNGIIATGAELVNCFCVGKEKQAILSQHMGDLKNIETYEYYVETIDRFKKLFRIEPELIVSDLHPDYLSTQYAQESKLKHIKVQHHHAHIASCMAEHGLDEKVIGVSFDGTGLGDDNNIWGSEFFVCDLKSYERQNHFEYVPMPGGDKVTHEPWRMALSYLYKVYGKKFINLNLAFLKDIHPYAVNILCHSIDNNLNCPLTSSCGRLFDAVAALINLCTVSRFHAEAPMRLESIINQEVKQNYTYSVTPRISFNDTIKQIVNDLIHGISVSVISAKFHNTVISIVNESVINIRNSTGLNKVVLSGGSFQNKYILKNVEDLLLKNNFNVYSHSSIPSNDGGISLGQLVIAAKNR